MRTKFRFPVKETDKIYYHHTGFPGGLKSISFKDLMEKDPTKAIEKAVKGMLPHNTLGAEQFTKLKVYAGAEHPHAAQNLKVMKWRVKIQSWQQAEEKPLSQL